MTVKRTKNFYKRFKLACQKRRFNSKKNSLFLNKQKKGFFAVIKEKSKKAYFSLKSRINKEPILVDELSILERRVSVALSGGMEPPELANIAAFYNISKRSSLLKNSELWVNDSSIFSNIKSTESKAHDFGLYTDDEMFTEYLVRKSTGKEYELLGERLLGNLYSMHRLNLNENFFEEKLFCTEEVKATPQKSMSFKVPKMCTLDDSNLKNNVKL